MTLIFVLPIAVGVCSAEPQQPAGNELQQELAQYQEQQTISKKTVSFDIAQGIGVQYHYPFFSTAMNATSSGIANGNTRITVYDSQGTNIGTIDLRNVIQNGKIDVLSYTGLNENLKTSGEVAITYGNDWELSYFNLSGNATAHNQILTHKAGGWDNYIDSTLTNDLSIDVFSLQKSWDVVDVDPLSFQVLIGAKAIIAKYNYFLQTAAPSDIIKPNYSGAIANSVPLPVPYIGLGYRLNLGDFYINNTFAGLPGLPGFVSNWVQGTNVSFFQMYFDCNYRVNSYVTVQAGYRLVNVSASIPAATVARYLGSEFALPAGFGDLNINTELNGPYLGLNIHL
jgi:hypothetical protein